MSITGKCYILIFLASLGTLLTASASDGEEGSKLQNEKARASFQQAFNMFKEICLDGLPDFRRSKDYASEKFGASFDDRKDRTWTPLSSGSFVKSVTISRGDECSVYLDVDGRDEQLSKKFRTLLPDIPSSGIHYISAGMGDDVDHLAKWQYLIRADENTDYRLLKEYRYVNTRLGDRATLTLGVAYHRFECTVTREQLELFGLTGAPPREGLLLSHAERWC